LSSYENYTEVSAHYDDTRVAIGGEILVGALSMGRVRLDETQLLDAGCGTGTFAALLAPLVSSVSLVDASDGMLRVAEAKLAGRAAELRQGVLQALPFDDDSFDAVMTNQVLHHIGDEQGGDWPEHRRVFAEYARVLRPGGVLVVNTSSTEQLRDGFWYYDLIPQAADVLRRRYAPLSVLADLAEANRLTVTGQFVPIDAVLQGPSYFDGAGPLSEAWRRGDSSWSLVDDAEMAAMAEQVTTRRDRGELDAYVAETDARRRSIGQVTFVVARRAVD
jgi:ubiquinone/menaquinone biosynthesis C-methylase UbiE